LAKYYIVCWSTTSGHENSRNDELGIPLGITVDFQTVKDDTITLRERDNTTQVRASEDQILEAVKAIVDGKETWQDVQKRLPAFDSKEVD